MNYDDQAKRFNLATGLACGAAVGVGMALLIASRRTTPVDQALRGARRLSGRVAAGSDAAREALSDLAATATRAGRKQFRS